MKFYLYFIFFILLSFNVHSSWQTYQNDLRNTGIANGTGYFPLKTANFSYVGIGMDFQPLVDDLNKDGNNEIVIFSNKSLVVFNPQLEILAQAKVGTILGQPALFNFDNDNFIEIIFNSRQNADYFFAYQYSNSNLQQEFNISMTNANLSGIKCLNLSGTNSCVFKDKKNYIHIINMSSRTDSSYSTSSYEEYWHTVPAIGDIDNDGSLEAVFWFNEDNTTGYGFLVFDLSSRTLDASFNNSGIVDNIFESYAWLPTTFALKGQPVLVDLNDDNNLEIAASVFYDDYIFPAYGIYSDWFTELFVYSYNGSKLFSMCEVNPSSGWRHCNHGGSHKWEGTNPFVLDYDKDDIDDICFIKNGPVTFGVVTKMVLNCYNHSGGELSEINLSNVFGETVRGYATTADINNDGIKEIVTFENIFLLNGTSIMDFSSVLVAAIVAVDADSNKGLDLVWTEGNLTNVFLDNNNYTTDLSVSSSDISFLKLNKTHVNVSAIIKNSGQVEANNIKTIIYNAETLENKTAALNIRRNGNASFTEVFGLKEGEKVMVSVDFDNEINETDEENNFAVKEFTDLPNVFVSVNVEPFNVNSEFKNYIKNKLTSGYYTEKESSADVIVYIGKNNPRNIVNNVKTLNDFEFGYDFGNVIYYDKIGANPYAGLAGAFKDNDGKVKIMLVGNEIEGDIIAAKEFIKNQPLLLNTKDKNSIFIDDENADAVKVFDYLHNGINNEHYMQQTEQFKDIVRMALNDSMFTITEYNVTTSNSIVLRLRNIRTNLSSDYLLYLNSSQDVFMPVVMAGGIWSDITAWQELGGELSSNGRDVWLIEITGGPNTECDSCINYNYTHLVDEFWPALVAAVQGYTSKNKIQYVGHSNGCRTALDSLTNWSSSGKNNVGIIVKDGNNITVSLSSNPIDTFVAVGCPGNFSELSYFAKQVKSSGDIAIKRLDSKNNLHPKFGDVAHELESVLGEIAGVSRAFNNPKISLNLFKQYYEWIKDEGDRQPGDKLTFSHFTLIYGTDGFLFSKNDDQIVAVTDELAIYDKINSSDKKLISIAHKHTGMTEDKNIKSNIKKTLNS